MIDIIAHRINTIEGLKSIPKNFGIEVDIRSSGQDLIISHDPYLSGDNFEAWIKSYNHKLLILNVKEEGLESKIIEIMKKENIDNYFFLDQSFPFLIKNAKNCLGRSAVRYSEFESIDNVLSLKGIVKWVWVDCFNYLPIDKENIDIIKNSHFKICIVSPELQGRFDNKEIFDICKKIKDYDIKIDAVCTKKIDLWREIWTVN
jgi:hypothetical protein